MKKVVIIEDDEILVNARRKKFLEEGYEVEVAPDGERGLELVRRFRPDAVILDLTLPKITGIELMQKLRAESDFERLPFIVLSNMYLSDMVRDAWKAGATKCLSKTYCTHRELLEVVRTTLANNAASLAAAGPTDSIVTASPPPSPVATEADAAFQADLRQTFIESLPARMGSLRAPLQAMMKTGDETARLQHLYELQRRMRALTGTAGTAGMVRIARMSEALEALLQELFEKPQNFNASTRRTAASAIDFLGFLAENATLPQCEIPPANILVVDDDALSRRAVTRALEKARLKCVSVDDPHDALKLLTAQSYDLVVLDVVMPRMNGFELCTKLRALPGHKKTQVIFVTSLNDLESRAASTMSGGNDFIAKPFMFMELAVKVLIPVLRGKLDSRPRPAH